MDTSFVDCFVDGIGLAGPVPLHSFSFGPGYKGYGAGAAVDRARERPIPENGAIRLSMEAGNYITSFFQASVSQQVLPTVILRDVANQRTIFLTDAIVGEIQLSSPAEGPIVASVAIDFMSSKVVNGPVYA